MERERKMLQQKEQEAKALAEVCVILMLARCRMLSCPCLQAAKKGGTVAVKQEQKFQAFWRNLNGVDDDDGDEVGVLRSSAVAPPASPPHDSP